MNKLILHQPLSGPFYEEGCLIYASANVTSYVAHDYIWLYPAIFIAPLFVVLTISIHYIASGSKKIYSQSVLIHDQ